MRSKIEVRLRRESVPNGVPGRPKVFWLPAVPDALSAPVKVFFNPSGACPNRCLTCFAEELSHVELSDAVAEEAFDQIVKMPVFWLNLGGCELLMYHRYFEFAEKAIRNGINTSSAISGIGLTKRWAERARDLGVKIKVSIDGPKRINDIQRPGTYEAAIEAIEVFRSIGYPVKINMVHTRLNNSEEAINEMFEIAVRHGATGIDLSICRPKGGALRNNLMIPFEDYQNGKVRSVLQRLLTHPDIERHNLRIWINKNARTLDRLEAKSCQVFDIHCNAGRYSMGVNNNGLVDACIFLLDEYIPKANVNNPSLMTDPGFILGVWQNDPTFRKVRQYTSGELCPRCKAKGITFVRGCRACADFYGGIDPLTLLH